MGGPFLRTTCCLLLLLGLSLNSNSMHEGHYVGLRVIIMFYIDFHGMLATKYWSFRPSLWKTLEGSCNFHVLHIRGSGYG